MSWSFTVAGSLMLDETTTPHGHHHDLLGGSMAYAALAASRYTHVHAIGCVGDQEAETIISKLEKSGIDVHDIDILAGHTFRESSHHQDGRVTIITSEPGVYSNWLPRPSRRATSAEILFVGSMHPDVQQAVIRASGAQLIAVDSMTMYIERHRREVTSVAASADLVFLNEEELLCLVGQVGDWRRQARALIGVGRTRAVVVKHGAAGAAYVTKTDIVELPAVPVAQVIDPSGAGDCLAGGFLGACAAAMRVDDGFAKHALQTGLECAAQAISDFGVCGLIQPERHGAF